MKKKIYTKAGTVLLILCLLLNPFTNVSYASTQSKEIEINDVYALKYEIKALEKDGKISTFEKNNILDRTEKSVLEEFIDEKIKKAVEIVNSNPNIRELSSFEKQEYELGDGCILIVELSDNGTSNLTKSSGSNTLWKEYGNRMFTAKVTVNFIFGKVTMELVNHYTLSSNGIDERYGESKLIYDNSNGEFTVYDPIITDSVARTAGASDVNMECNYRLKYKNYDNCNVEQKYKMVSNIGFVAIDKTTKKIQVKQSWNLLNV